MTLTLKLLAILAAFLLTVVFTATGRMAWVHAIVLFLIEIAFFV